MYLILVEQVYVLLSDVENSLSQCKLLLESKYKCGK